MGRDFNQIINTDKKVRGAARESISNEENVRVHAGNPPRGFGFRWAEIYIEEGFGARKVRSDAL